MSDPIINIAVQAARSAGNIIMRAYSRPDKMSIREKSPHDFTTDVDERAEKSIVQIIQKAYPDHSILCEESGLIQSGDSQWIIDPLDGTRNFIHGFPHFAISIAFQHKNRIEHGIIYDPVRQELFTASRGRGAQLNGTRIRVSTKKNLSDCLLATGFAFRHQGLSHQALPKRIFQSILDLTQDIRRTGSAALDLAYVAAGRLDGFWEFGLHPWDFAAGVLLIKEAGGLASDPLGGEDFWNTGQVVAANATVLRLLLQILNSAQNEQAYNDTIGE